MRSQTIRQMKAIASCMGITLHELIRRRVMRAEMDAYTNDAGEVRIRPRLYCCPDLPDNYQTQPRLIR